MNRANSAETSPSVRLFTAPGCPHCNGVKVSLTKLQEEELIEAFEVIDITQQPDLAEAVGVRSVPWLEIGSLTLIGEQQLSELRNWIARLSDTQVMVDYYETLLVNGELSVAESVLQKSPATLPSLLLLMIQDNVPLQVRIGAVALLEGFAGREPLQQLIPQLAEQLQHQDYRIRADIAYLLGLTASSLAIEPLQKALEDSHHEVREIATEAIDEIG
ncbi:MAG: HEAT repeat domain-containing protein [Gammaproteobacteria bacterium]|nr:HEAT repeat domain-containing protein [Gammaproteobacteria bacterium]